MLKRLILGLMAATLLAKSAQSFDWPYQNPSRDVVLSAVVGTQADAVAWINGNRSRLLSRFDAVPSMAPSSVFDGQWQAWPNAGPNAQLLQVIGTWPAGHPLKDAYVGAFVSKPGSVDPGKPLVIALHGHEVAHRGEPPAKLWTDRWWPEELVKAGYVVITPSHLLYTQLAALYSSHDHHAVWTRVAWDIVQASRSTPSGFPLFSGYVVVGVSSGGTTASFLAAWRSEITKGVYAGSLIPLEWLRREYRIAGIPNAWNVRDLYSYLPLYLMAAHKRQQWQIGTADSLFPNGVPFPASGGFSGTTRDVMATEVLGEFLSVRDVAAKVGGSAELRIHSAGHSIDVASALAALGN